MNAQNDCNNPLVISAGAYTVPVVDGIDAPNPICSPNTGPATHAEWYSYTPTQDYSVTVTTDLIPNAGGDTRFNVYSGSCGAFTCVDGDDDSGAGVLSISTFQATQGTEYTIAFDDRWQDTGFDFELIEAPPIQFPLTFTPTTIALTGSAMCIVDMNNDHLDDVVGVNSTNINIHYQQSGGSFLSTNITTSQANYPASWSMCAGDIDANGYTDLLYAGGGGVTFMMANNTGTAFTEISGPEYVFCQRSNMVDINNDGHLDAFVCHDVDPNVYYMNDGFGNLTFNQGGLGDSPSGGNYGSIWTDVDGDHDIDLFIAKCGSANINQFHMNDGFGNYTEVAGMHGLMDNIQTWSSAWGDFDNDGDMDAVIGASSMVNGGHRVMENINGQFTDVAVGSGFDLFSGTSIEWITHDFNNDGFLDVLGAGALMLGNGDLTFMQASITPLNGPIGDLNDDGFLDIQNGNTLYMNDGNSNHYFKVHTVGTVSNANGIGARVKIVTPSGDQIRDIKSGDGFHNMSSMAAHFGLGSETQILEVTVYWPSGIVNTISNPNIDGSLEIVEGISTGVDENVFSPVFSVFPNPAQNALNLSASEDLLGSSYAMFNISGQKVLSGTLANGQVDISSLPSSIYMVRVEQKDGYVQQTQFVKTE